jgi:hypothetical protein
MLRGGGPDPQNAQHYSGYQDDQTRPDTEFKE